MCGPSGLLVPGCRFQHHYIVRGDRRLAQERCGRDTVRFFGFVPSRRVGGARRGSHGHGVGRNNQLVVARAAARMLARVEGRRRGQWWPRVGSMRDRGKVGTDLPDLENLRLCGHE